MAENTLTEKYNLLEEQVTPESLFDYDQDINYYTYPLEAFFRKRTIQGKYYDFTQNQKGQVMAARYHPLNAPTDLVSREKVAVSRASLAYVKQEIAFDEDDILSYNSPRTDAEFKYAEENIYDDGTRPIIAIREKREIQRAMVITTGKLTVDENGYQVEYDFGIPKENFKDFKWFTGGDSVNIYDDIAAVVEQLTNNGQNVAPAYILASPKVINTALQDATVRKEMATLNPSMRITLEDLNGYLTKHSMPIFVPINRLVTEPDETLSQGTQRRLIPEDKIIFLPKDPIGDFVSGTTPEEGNVDATMQLARQDDIVVTRFKKHDPEGQFTKASARFFSTLTVPKQIVIGTVK